MLRKPRVCSPGAVDGQRLADHGLQAEAVEHGAEQLVVVEARDQALVGGPSPRSRSRRRRPGSRSVARRPQVRQAKWMLVESWTFEQVVQRARQLRERQRVRAPLVLDLDVALLDVDVRAGRTRPSSRA